MNPSCAFLPRSRLPVIGAMVLVALAFVLTHPAAGKKFVYSTFDVAARGSQGGHEWLLVGEPGTHQLLVYDAVDGRPLQRLPVHGVLDHGGVLLMPSQRPSVDDDPPQGQRKSPGGPDAAATRH